MTIATRFMMAALLMSFACGGDNGAADENGAAATASNKQVEEDLADLTKYDLNMNKMDKFVQTMRNMGQIMKGMTPAEREALENLNANNATLDQMIDNAEKNKVVREATRKAGSSPREYVLTSMAYFQSAMALAVAQMQPNANQDSLAREMKVNPDNIKFIKENEAELTRKYQAVSEELKVLGFDDDDNESSGDEDGSDNE